MPGNIYPEDFLNLLDDDGMKFLQYLMTLSDKEVYSLHRDCSPDDLMREPIIRREVDRRRTRHWCGMTVINMEKRSSKAKKGGEGSI